MSTLRVTNIEAKGDPSSPSVDEKLKLTNSTGDIVLEVDGKNVGAGQTVFVGSGIVTATQVNVGTAVTISAGIITATSFSGNVVGNVTGNLTGNADSSTTATTAINALGITTTQITVGNSFLKDEAVGLGTTTTTGRNSGVGTAVGQMIYNATTGNVQVYKAINGWVNITHVGDDPPEGHTATGGTITNYTDGGKRYRLHEFLTSGTFTVTTVGNIESTVDYLVVGSGGGGGTDTGSGTGGGGGAGGFRTTCPEGPGGPSPATESAFTVTATSYTVTIGSGGAIATRGNPTSFGSVTSEGGGKGAPNSGAGGAGGCGGAGGGPGGAVGLGNRVVGDPATPAPPQGWDSGATSGPTGSGGGGAGGVGGDIPAGFVFNDGGVAKRSSISGPTYSIGGPAPPVESPGTGYFAAGGSNSANDMGAGNGVRNTAATGQFGSGGGGGAGGSPGAAGADGVVYVRYEVNPSQ